MSTRHARSVVALIGFALTIAAAILSPRLAPAGHNPPQNSVALPNPAAGRVLVFRSGRSAWDGTKWTHTRNGFDGLCEGIIRQEMGLLDTRGQMIPVPEGNQLKVGGKVVGFQDNLGLTKAYNIEQPATFRMAMDALEPGQTLWSCGHGYHLTSEAGGKGGLIRLDGGGLYQGFFTVDHPRGTRRSARADLRPMGPLPTPGGLANVQFHHCWTARDPDGPGEPMVSVDTTMDSEDDIVVNHGHIGTAMAAVRYDVDVVGSIDVDDVEHATQAIRSSSIHSNFLHQHYAAGQAAINKVISVPGAIVPHLTYGDTGDGGDPPEENVVSACATPGSFHCYATTATKEAGTAGLEDMLGAGNYEVKRSKELCIPANRDVHGGTDVDPTSLRSYKVKGDATKHDSVRVVTEFGELLLKVGPTKTLLVPAQINPPIADQDQGVLEPDLHPTIDHLRCSKVGPAKGAAKFAKGTVVTVSDRLASVDVTLKKPFELCAATSVDGGLLGRLDSHLLCFKGKADEKTSVSDVHTADLRAIRQVDIKKSRTFCVVATLPGLEPSCGNDQREVTEECDGTDDDSCPGQCDSSCLCPQDKCGNGVVETGEECEQPGDVAPCEVDEVCGPECLCVDATGCLGEETTCGDDCTNPNDDPDNCGTCGNTCGAGETCCGGTCTTDPTCCGDGVVNVAGEICDGTDDAECPGGCQSDCTCCGDGTRQSGVGELCDGTDFGPGGAPTNGQCSADCSDACAAGTKFKFYGPDYGRGNICVDACGTTSGSTPALACYAQGNNFDCRVDDGIPINWYDSSASPLATTPIANGNGCALILGVDTDVLIDGSDQCFGYAELGPGAPTHCTTGTCSPECQTLGPGLCVQISNSPANSPVNTPLGETCP